MRSLPVSRSDLESLLGSLSRPPTDRLAGVFGPNSMFWTVSRESALFLAAGRAALLQLAHPWVAAAIAEHSTVLGDPITRFHNTFRIVFTLVFGSLDQALAAARSLHTLHTHIRGELPVSVAGWREGSHYEANELSALRWVHATLIESAVLAWECVLPVTAAEREQYYQESKTLAAFFGIPAGALPQDWADFVDYNREMAASNALGISTSARSLGQGILRGAGSPIHPPRWYRSLTASWLPPRFREEFGLPFTPADQRAVARSRLWLAHIYPRLPAPLRFVGPWREAQARLRNRAPGRLTEWSNRFWIGQPLTPFREDS